MDRHQLQNIGQHTAPCARHCEAAAFQSEIRQLHQLNRTFRAAQKACADCGPNEALWSRGGEPVNLEAAAEDAYEWLMWLAKRHRSDKLNDCISSLKEYMRPVSPNT